MAPARVTLPDVETTVRVDEVDPWVLDGADLADLGALVEAERLADAPHQPPESARQLQLRLRHGWEGYPTDHLLVARDSSGVVGFGEVSYGHWDNPDVAAIFLHVLPSSRADDSVADALRQRATEIARADGRTKGLSDSWRDSWLAGYWERTGWPVASRAAQRRLDMATLDLDRLGHQLAEAERTSEAYDVVELPTPTPEDLVEGLLDVHRAMNDAPLDDLEIEDDEWSPERLVASEASLAGRGLRVHRLMARRRSDGVLAGYTVVLVDPETPEHGFQEDTAVVGEHRGHRLGLRLKVAMLLGLRELEPQLTLVDTWNAESNTHMIAVNERLGCYVVARGQLVQQDLG